MGGVGLRSCTKVLNKGTKWTGYKMTFRLSRCQAVDWITKLAVFESIHLAKYRSKMFASETGAKCSIWSFWSALGYPRSDVRFRISVNAKISAHFHDSKLSVTRGGTLTAGHADITVQTSWNFVSVSLGSLFYRAFLSKFSTYFWCTVVVSWRCFGAKFRFLRFPNFL